LYPMSRCRAVQLARKRRHFLWLKIHEWLQNKDNLWLLSDTGRPSLLKMYNINLPEGALSTLQDDNLGYFIPISSRKIKHS